MLFLFSVDDGEKAGRLVPLKRRCEGAGIVTFTRAISANYRSPWISEQHGAVPPRNHSREVKDTDASERPHGLPLTSV